MKKTASLGPQKASGLNALRSYRVKANPRELHTPTWEIRRARKKNVRILFRFSLFWHYQFECIYIFRFIYRVNTGGLHYFRLDPHLLEILRGVVEEWLALALDARVVPTQLDPPKRSDARLDRRAQAGSVADVADLQKQNKRAWTRCAVCDTTPRGSGRARRLRKGRVREERD